MFNILKTKKNMLNLLKTSGDGETKGVDDYIPG
jgi:hypothetical protein